VLGRVLTAVVTPFHADGSIDFERFQRLLEYLVENGSDGVVVAGTTGESPTLEDGERLELITAACEVLAGRASVVAGTGTASTAHSIELTRHAEARGADAFLIVTPYYNKPPQAGILAHFEAIARCTDRPLIAYNIPSRVVVNIEPETISRLAEIETLVAVKQAHPDLDEARHIVACGLDLYAGDDVLVQGFLELGALGGICVHTHLVGPQVAEQVQAAARGAFDEARRIDAELAPVYELLTIATNPIAIKAALDVLGWELGGHRLPLVGPDEAQLQAIRSCLSRLGLPVAA
jgi:4-hydroxy-tetrahydrodipicolinate synthase